MESLDIVIFILYGLVIIGVGNWLPAQEVVSEIARITFLPINRFRGIWLAARLLQQIFLLNSLLECPDLVLSLVWQLLPTSGWPH